jgi:hypothetical protein
LVGGQYPNTTAIGRDGAVSVTVAPVLELSAESVAPVVPDVFDPVSSVPSLVVVSPVVSTDSVDEVSPVEVCAPHATRNQQHATPHFTRTAGDP